MDGLQKQVVGERKMRDMTLQCHDAGSNVGACALVSLEPRVRANAFTDTMDQTVLPRHALLPKDCQIRTTFPCQEIAINTLAGEGALEFAILHFRVLPRKNKFVDEKG